MRSSLTMNHLRPDLRVSCVKQPTDVLGCTPQRTNYDLVLYPGCAIYESYFLYTINYISNETNVLRKTHTHQQAFDKCILFILKLTMQIQTIIQMGKKNVMTRFRQMLSANLKEKILQFYLD